MTKGFTLIEVVIVASITVLITGLLVANFSRTRLDLNQTALLVTDAIREAQALALAGSTVEGEYRCGYGINFQEDGYIIYAGPVATTDCSADDYVYDSESGDTEVREAFFSNNVLEIVLPAPDIYFVPPNPTTYIDGFTTPPTQTTVTIRRKLADCSGTGNPDCHKITVTTSGLIQSQQ